MLKPLLDPKIDFVFKKIFGSEKHPRILISFLNAIMKPKNPIVGVQFMNTDIEKNFVEDKFSRLDVKPKLNEDSDERDMLVAWTQFLKNPQSEKVRKLEMSIDEIKEAKDELIRLSNDDKERAIYEMRNKTLRDEISALNKAKEEGIKQGIEKGKIEMAIQSLKFGLDEESVAKITGLSIEKVFDINNKTK